ncbi:alpha/beta fold hydrolase [Glycomyces albidus]|uniref:Alpha/beta fold hydrolase n=1 Tax=Glycomyces albidus TaxID=2656774 RepID=A0A6L5G9Q9_9ACTN|nr:alpha/beta fold hydrolase [Glycomyces albidus]MQM26346.1 alpha/beta fold hydrolase [Glycomyces albidus]
MTNHDTHANASAWSGLVPVDDTALYVTDTGGDGIPVVYCNGQFATLGYWKHVVEELGSGFRHINFDERARGKRSKTSSDYSFEACIRDVDAVLAARGVTGPVLIVGWSYGAFVAAHWAQRNPDRALGAVLVDGAQPHDWLTDAMEERIRKLFKRLRPITAILRPTGLTPNLSAAQQAECNIELGKISREANLGPVIDGLAVPTRYVFASGASLGSKGDEQEDIRAAVDKYAQRNPNVKIFAKVPSNHDHILRKDFRTVADAVREVATARN